ALLWVEAPATAILLAARSTVVCFVFFFQAEDGIRDRNVTGVQTCALRSREPIKVDTLGGPQNMVCINESGLYTLIIRSNKPNAKKFRRWITHDVLPSIRKHGLYAVDE